MKKRKKNRPSHDPVQFLFDSFYRDHVISVFQRWAETARTETESTLYIKTIKEQLLTPLNQWTETRGRGKDNTATKAATALYFAINEIIIGLEYYGIEATEIEKARQAWVDFQIYADSGGDAYAQNQRERASNTRGGDVIKELVYRAYRQMPEGRAREIWPLLYNLLVDQFDHECEVVEDARNRRQPKTWVYRYGDRTLSFKTFENILSEIKKTIKI